MKSNNNSVIKYKEKYCKERRIRGRQAIYVSSGVHSELKELAESLKGEYVTTASLADSILRSHLDNNKNIITEIKGENKILAKPSHSDSSVSNDTDNKFSKGMFDEHIEY